MRRGLLLTKGLSYLFLSIFLHNSRASMHPLILLNRCQLLLFTMSWKWLKVHSHIHCPWFLRNTLAMLWSYCTNIIDHCYLKHKTHINHVQHLMQLNWTLIHQSKQEKRKEHVIGGKLPWKRCKRRRLVLSIFLQCTWPLLSFKMVFVAVEPLRMRLNPPAPCCLSHTCTPQRWMIPSFFLERFF